MITDVWLSMDAHPDTPPHRSVHHSSGTVLSVCKCSPPATSCAIAERTHTHNPTDESLSSRFRHPPPHHPRPPPPTQFHHGKHHRAYVDTLNKLVAGKPMDSMPLQDIIMQSWNNGNPTPEFNQAAQVRWGHA